MKKNETNNVSENVVVMDNATMEAIIEDNLHLVPRNQLKKFQALSLEEQKKQVELRKVNENMKSIIQPDGSVFYQTEYDIQKANEIDDIDEQIALVRQVIDKVILD